MNITHAEFADAVSRAKSTIRIHLLRNNLSPSGFGKQAGLYKDTLRYIDSPTWNPTLKTLSACLEMIPEPTIAERLSR